MTSWWSSGGEAPPETWPENVRRYAVDAAVITEAADVVEDAVEAEQSRQRRREIVAESVLAELVLPRISPDHLAEALATLDRSQMRDVAVLLRRARWTLDAEGLRPPSTGLNGEPRWIVGGE